MPADLPWHLKNRGKTLSSHIHTHARTHTHTHTHTHTYLLIHSMQHIPSWDANCFSASQEIPRTLWNPKVHHHIHKCPPPVPILSQLNLVHNPTSYFLKIYLNIILPSIPQSPKCLFPSGFLSKTLNTPLLPSIHATCPAYLILFYFIMQTVLGEEYRSLSSSLCTHITL